MLLKTHQPFQKVMTVAEVKHDNLPKPTLEHGAHAHVHTGASAESAVRTQLRGVCCGFTENINVQHFMKFLLCSFTTI